MKYCDKLPRKTKNGGKCQALLSNGDACPNTATHETTVHADPESRNLFEEEPSWYRINVCNKHLDWHTKRCLAKKTQGLPPKK